MKAVALDGTLDLRHDTKADLGGDGLPKIGAVVIMKSMASERCTSDSIVASFVAIAPDLVRTAYAVVISNEP